MFYGLNEQKQKALNQALGVIHSLYPHSFIGDHLISLDRNLGFLRDQPFMNAFNRNATTAQEKSQVWRLHTLAWAAKHCLNVPGDFVECGVRRGFSTSVLTEYLQFDTITDRRFVLYDTFEGIPEGYEDQAEWAGAYREEGLLEKVINRFSAYPNVVVVQGVVPEVFEKNCPEKVALLHLDMNSSRAEVGALEVLYERMDPGSMIVLDDYGWLGYRALHQAENEFFQRHGSFVLELPTGQGLVVKH